MTTKRTREHGSRKENWSKFRKKDFGLFDEQSFEKLGARITLV